MTRLLSAGAEKDTAFLRFPNLVRYTFRGAFATNR
jgi:hypothetical protein